MPQSLEEQLDQLVPFHVEVDEVLKSVQTSRAGLSQKETEARQQIFGPNKLKEKKSYSIVSLLIGQFTNFLVILLIGGGVLSYFLGEVLDAIAILAIVVLNAALGFFQEFKAEKSLEALKKIETPKATVIRNGEEMTIDTEKVVPGDILTLYEGNKIAADARLIEEHSLEVDESLLTGESVPVAKQVDPLGEHLAIGDQKNMVFSGCLVTKGRGVAVVVFTGESTEIGQIASEIQSTENDETPLQKAVGRLGKVLGYICIGVVIPGVIYGVLTNRDLVEMLILGISIAVAAIPEGLPIVVTIALALGIRRMVKVNVLIRRLSAAETLGSTDVICSDKTGTITHNQMTITEVFIPQAGFYRATGEGYDTKGEFHFDAEKNNSIGIKDGAGDPNRQHLTNLMESAVLCSDATLEIGDPTERALIVGLVKLGMNDRDLRRETPRLDEVPFDSHKKYMVVLVESAGKKRLIVKGALEVIMGMTSLDAKEKEFINGIGDELSSQGLRVLAIAEKDTESNQISENLSGFRVTGLICMLDPAREEVKSALEFCRQAGVRVIMITGDHPKTAEVIAQKIGLETQKVVTGMELDTLNDQQFVETVKTTNVFARVSPHHKLRILTVLQELGHQVAMTGDGVNDAPAVKKADIGIVVGSGTDLAKSVSDMILLDDNFATIINGIKEGRRIFFNIRKFVRYLLSANFGEILVVMGSLFLGTPLPLLPLQILWMNLATDSLPALALTSDTVGEEVMHKKPYKPQKEIINKVVSFAVLIGVISFITTMGIFLFSYNSLDLNLHHARTLALTSLVMFELFLAFSIRSETEPFWVNLFENRFLWFSVGVGFLGQLFIIYHPLGQAIFETASLNLIDWVLVLVGSTSGFVVVELLKYIDRKFPRIGRFIPLVDNNEHPPV